MPIFETDAANKNQSRSRRGTLIVSLLLLLYGGSVGVGGGVLALNGGSIGFLLAGIGTILSSLLLWIRPVIAAGLYGAVLGGSILWSVEEVGGDIVQLAPRLLLPVVLGLGFVPILMRNGSRGLRSASTDRHVSLGGSR